MSALRPQLNGPPIYTHDAAGNPVIQRRTDQTGPDGETVYETVPFATTGRRPNKRRTKEEWEAINAKYGHNRAAYRVYSSRQQPTAITALAAVQGPAASAAQQQGNDAADDYDGYGGGGFPPSLSGIPLRTTPVRKRPRFRRQAKPRKEVNAELHRGYQRMLPVWTLQYIRRQGMFPDTGGLHPIAATYDAAALLGTRYQYVHQEEGCPGCGNREANNLYSLDDGAHITYCGLSTGGCKQATQCLRDAALIDLAAAKMMMMMMMMVTRSPWRVRRLHAGHQAPKVPLPQLPPHLSAPACPAGGFSRQPPRQLQLHMV
jgi:hypothetical protein